MILSIPTSTGMLNICLNASMLKLLALLFGLISLFTGYVLVQVSTFILRCTPEQFFHIVIFTTSLIALYLVTRFVLDRKQVAA